MANFSSYTLTSSYGTRSDPFTGKTKSHAGNDYALPSNTKVSANVSGTVVRSAKESETGGYGNLVVVQDGQGRMHYYAHLNSNSVGVGDRVAVGDTLGLSGSTGRSTGPHLHYEVRDSSGNTMNPTQFANGSISSTTSTGTKSSGTKSSGTKSSGSSTGSSGSKSSGSKSSGSSTGSTGYATRTAAYAQPTGIITGTKNKLKEIVFNILKFGIIAGLIILFVVFIVKGLDIKII